VTPSRRTVAAVFVAGIAPALGGCRDLSSFSNHGDHYQGQVVQADFVRAGVDASTVMCLTIDADHLEDMPGVISSSDGRFASSALRPIPQIWHDPLSTLSFGDGRLKNLVYVVTAAVPFGDGGGDDVFTVVSLMQAGDIEIREIRGAPLLQADASPAPLNVFAVFDVQREPGSCSF
jgi:hypothetical protein